MNTRRIRLQGAHLGRNISEIILLHVWSLLGKSTSKLLHMWWLEALLGWNIDNTEAVVFLNKQRLTSKYIHTVGN